MPRTLFDHLVLDPDPYFKKYGELSDPLTDKQSDAIDAIGEQITDDDLSVFEMTVPEFLEDEGLFDASRQWFRNLLYRFPAHWLSRDNGGELDILTIEQYDELFESGEKKYPYSEAGYACSLEDCDFESHWRVSMMEHVNSTDEEHKLYNRDFDRIQSPQSNSGGLKWQDATVRGLVAEYPEPYKERWGESPQLLKSDVDWLLTDVEYLREELEYGIDYNMTVEDFLEVYSRINKTRENFTDEEKSILSDKEKIIYKEPSVEAFRKYLLRVTSEEFASVATNEIPSGLPEESKNLEYAPDWKWRCRCGDTFDTRREAKEHVRDERADIDSSHNEFWDHGVEKPRKVKE